MFSAENLLQRAGLCYVLDFMRLSLFCTHKSWKAESGEGRGTYNMPSTQARGMATFKWLKLLASIFFNYREDEKSTTIIAFQ